MLITFFWFFTLKNENASHGEDLKSTMWKIFDKFWKICNLKKIYKFFPGITKTETFSARTQKFHLETLRLKAGASCQASSSS